MTYNTGYVRRCYLLRYPLHIDTISHSPAPIRALETAITVLMRELALVAIFPLPIRILRTKCTT